MLFLFGVDEGIRTSDLLLRRQLLYPAELRRRILFVRYILYHKFIDFSRGFWQIKIFRAEIILRPDDILGNFALLIDPVGLNLLYIQGRGVRVKRNDVGSGL